MKFLLATLILILSISARAELEETASTVDGVTVATQSAFPAYRTLLSRIRPTTVIPGLKTLGRHGIDPEFYLKRLSNPREKLSDPQLMLLLQAIKDVATGRLEPSLLASDIKFRKRALFSPTELTSILGASAEDFTKLIDTVAPQNQYYRSLLAGRAKWVKTCGTYIPTLAPEKELSLGVTDASVIPLKNRLKALGYQMGAMDSVFDGACLRAINDIQNNIGVNPDGRLSPGGRTLRYLNQSCSERLQQIDADLEKTRWLPRKLESEHIFVNTAFAMFRFGDLYFRTVNGTADRRTPSMKDRVTHVVLNPPWVMPPTVFAQDLIPKVAFLAQHEVRQYFARNQYEVIANDTGALLDPSTIDWGGIANPANVRFHIRQKPGYGNSLGVVKFEMANPHTIAMHDTNRRELFSAANRLQSSGCVRLEKPLELAARLLAGTPWTLPKLKTTLAKLNQKVETETKVALKKQIPVYLISMTSLYASDETWRFTEDHYGHNSLIRAKLKKLGR